MGMTRYLVTGGAGFIGSHLVEALARSGEEVRVFDNLSTGDRKNLRGLEDRIDFIEGDIRDYPAVLEAMTGVEFVLHQAALPSVPRSIRDPITSADVNIRGTLHVLQAAREADARRVVAASSSSVYGDNPALPKHEDMCPRPISPYAVSKLAGEQYCQSFWRVYGLETVALRYFNVFGPRQSPTSQYAAVIPKFIAALLSRQPLPVHGDGKQSRDFTYVENVVQANLLACTASDAPGRAFNVACGQRHTLLDLIEALSSVHDADVQVSHTAPRPGDVAHSLADISLARTILGYDPTVDFANGLRRTIEWHVDGP